MAKDNAMRRLERILSDEDYGPKLARLNRQDEAHVLDLIDRNQGRKARAEILRLDEERRAKRRTRTPSKPSQQTVDLDTLRAAAFQRMRQQVRGKYSTQRRGVDNMTQPILEFTTTATSDQIKERASLTVDEFWRAYGPVVVAPDIDYEFNPFWYN